MTYRFHFLLKPFAKFELSFRIHFDLPPFQIIVVVDYLLGQMLRLSRARNPSVSARNLVEQLVQPPDRFQ